MFKKAIVSGLAAVSLFSAGVMAAQTFNDVAADAWYAEGVEFVSSNGIMTGTSEGVFAPSETLNRAQLAVILKRYHEKAAAGEIVMSTSTDGEETTSTDGEETTSTDGEETTSTDGEETTSTDGEETTSTDGEEETSTDGEEETSTDGEEETSADGEETTSTDGEEETSTDGEGQTGDTAPVTE